MSVACRRWRFSPDVQEPGPGGLRAPVLGVPASGGQRRQPGGAGEHADEGRTRAVGDRRSTRAELHHPAVETEDVQRRAAAGRTERRQSGRDPEGHVRTGRRAPSIAIG